MVKAWLGPTAGLQGTRQAKQTPTPRKGGRYARGEGCINKGGVCKNLESKMGPPNFNFRFQINVKIGKHYGTENAESLEKHGVSYFARTSAC